MPCKAGLKAAACPADAIFVEASENTDQARFSPGDRFASTYEINMLRCIFCGLCEEACPVEAIRLGPEYELADYDRHSLVYTKPMLLDPERKLARLWVGALDGAPPLRREWGSTRYARMNTPTGTPRNRNDPSASAVTTSPVSVPPSATRWILIPGSDGGTPAVYADTQLAAVLDNQLRYAIWSEERFRDWSWDPLVYTQLSGQALYGLLARDFAPLPDRTSPHAHAIASGGSSGRPKLIVDANPARFDSEGRAWAAQECDGSPHYDSFYAAIGFQEWARSPRVIGFKAGGGAALQTVVAKPAAKAAAAIQPMVFRSERSAPSMRKFQFQSRRSQRGVR